MAERALQDPKPQVSVEQLQAKIADMHETISELRRENTSLKTKMGQAYQKHREEKEEMDWLTEANCLLQEKNLFLQKRVSESQTKVGSVLTLLAEAQAEASEIRKQFELLTNKQEDLKKKIIEDGWKLKDLMVDMQLTVYAPFMQSIRGKSLELCSYMLEQEIAALSKMQIIKSAGDAQTAQAPLDMLDKLILEGLEISKTPIPEALAVVASANVQKPPGQLPKHCFNSVHEVSAKLQKLLDSLPRLPPSQTVINTA